MPLSLPQWLSPIPSPPAYCSLIISMPLFVAFTIWILVEVGFILYYHWHLIPRANRHSSTSSPPYHDIIKPPAPYRDYVDINDRQKLLIRILDRIIERNTQQHAPKQQQQQHDDDDDQHDQHNPNSIIVYNFIEDWFEKRNPNFNASYQRFSEYIDVTTLDVGLCPPLLPIIMRTGLANYSGVVNVGGNDNDDDEDDNDDDNGTNKSSNTSLSLLDGNDPSEGNFFPKENKLIKKSKDLGRIQKDNMDEFLAWAFFGIPITSVKCSSSMQQALHNLYDALRSRTGLVFEPGYNFNYQPRTFTFENVKSLYRPLLVYVIVMLMRMPANLVLYIMGFRLHTCRRGLRYWYRAPIIDQQKPTSPFLFFHGIAPGGHAPYLPMLFLGVLRGSLLSHRHRDVFIFENRPISYALCFDALSEEDTVHGVLEALQNHISTSSSNHNNLTMCGHSFGSCQLTWLVKCPELKGRIRSLYLLDPVSILLSEPDVVVNFLYSREEFQYKANNAPPHRGMYNKLIRFINEAKIHLVASSELFIEHYLRRNFAWYNSELWLHDVPEDVKIMVALAECDEIINAPKIVKEVDWYNATVSKDQLNNNNSSRNAIEKLIWRGVGHAHCITNPKRWSDIHHVMSKIETEILEKYHHKVD